MWKTHILIGSSGQINATADYLEYNYTQSYIQTHGERGKPWVSAYK